LIAAIRGYVDIANLLIEYGANVNESLFGIGGYRGYTPLMAAAFEGHPGVVKLLIDHGADVNAKVTEGESKGLIRDVKGDALK